MKKKDTFLPVSAGRPLAKSKKYPRAPLVCLSNRT